MAELKRAQLFVLEVPLICMGLIQLESQGTSPI